MPSKNCPPTGQLFHENALRFHPKLMLHDSGRPPQEYPIMPSRRFPPPWSVEELEATAFMEQIEWLSFSYERSEPLSDPL
jgi:hypothetical protein